MQNEDSISIAVGVDRLILESRLTDISLLAHSDRRDRIKTIATVISKLSPGAYLLGCGPYSCGVVPLTVKEVVLGRLPSPLESLPDTVADYTLNDAVWMMPREVSRIHAKIVRRQIGETFEYSVCDENSRNGTFVNGQRVGSAGDCSGANIGALTHGDVICLGPSGINSYVFIRVP